MDVHFTYLLVDFCCLVFPLVFSFHPRLRFYLQWRTFLLPCFLTAVLFLVWDSVFTYLHVWSFNPDYISGLYIGNLPVEEILFFFCIPYACVFSYHCFGILSDFTRFRDAVNGLYTLLAVILLSFGLMYLPLLYTSVTFITCGLFLFLLRRQGVSFLPVFFFCFLFILIPFLLSNGVLTGSFFGREVVRYNPRYNLGIRILTIPLEDVFYGMLLLLMNVYGFEYMKARLLRSNKDKQKAGSL